MNERILGSAPESGARRAYDPPRLEVYGDLSRLTTAVGMNVSPADSNTGKDVKTA